MTKSVLIVESPAKSKTLNKYLKGDVEILASFGHVRDLIPKQGAVDTEHDFAMDYELIARNKKHVDQIVKAVKKADVLYLATDPDREGEAISWHLYEILNQKKLLDNVKVHRVCFYEITKNAVQNAVANPRELSMDLVNAQQARRALDFLVGFTLSPLLWKKISRGLSAGRVQSPALRLIVEREIEIEKFISREYWTIDADLAKDARPLVAKLVEVKKEKIEQFSITDEKKAHEVKDFIIKQANGKLLVENVEQKPRKRNPSPPFITSTLQQEGVRKLGFSAKKTMMVAQNLYEGIDIGGEDGTVGLITYMRTDSINLSVDAIAEMREYIPKKYGKENLPDEPRVFKTKSKNAQEAHEAIRPTSILRTPDSLKNVLSADQLKLYELIWKRTLASQMMHATLSTTAITFVAGKEDARFRATGSTVVKPGFLQLYQEGEDDKKADSDDGRILPKVSVGEELALNNIITDQHFTEPPPRYSEASLVKTLEEYGIGRPSTYAAIISTLLAREYVSFEKKRFSPTDMGRIVSQFLTAHFTQYVDYNFTAGLEDELDAISRGEKPWVPVMEAFWKPFKALVDDKTESVSREEVIQARVLGVDELTGRNISVRMGRYGPFVQLGDREDKDPPRFVSLLSHQRLNTVTLEEANALLALGKVIGQTEKGEPIQVLNGPYGPYIKYGNNNLSLNDENPLEIDEARAIEIIKERGGENAKKAIQEFKDEDIKVLKGRYGPYVTNGSKNVKIPKDKDPATLTLAECKELLAKPKASRFKKAGKAKK